MVVGGEAIPNFSKMCLECEYLRSKKNLAQTLLCDEQHYLVEKICQLCSPNFDDHLSYR